MDNIRPDDRPCFTLGMKSPLSLDFPEQLRGSEKIDYGPSQIIRALARWENEGGAVTKAEMKTLSRTIKNARSDIATFEDIKRLVDAFYERVNRDAVLAPIFNEVARVDWAQHLPALYRFWGSMLLGAGSYDGAPFPKHAVLPIEQEHFERWLALFVEAVDENFAGPRSEEAKSRAVCIADTFARRMGVLIDAAALARLHFSGV